MLAIAGGKGGCGKTTTALGLAAALARQGADPLVVDADVEMPDLHDAAAVPADPGLASVAAGATPAAVAHESVHVPGVSVLPAVDARRTDLVEAAVALQRWSGPLLLDCPAGLAPDAIAPLRVADRSLLVTSPTRRALADTVKTLTAARTLDATPTGVILVENEPASRGSLESPIENAPEEPLSCGLLSRIPPAQNPVLTDENVRVAYDRAARKVKQRNI